MGNLNLFTSNCALDAVENLLSAHLLSDLSIIKMLNWLLNHTICYKVNALLWRAEYIKVWMLDIFYEQPFLHNSWCSTVQHSQGYKFWIQFTRLTYDSAELYNYADTINTYS